MWLIEVIGYGVLAAFGGLVGYVAFSSLGVLEDSKAQRFLAGIPFGVLGLGVGTLVFEHVLGTSGPMPLAHPVVLTSSGNSGGGLDYAHALWDLLIGLVGCAILAAPFAVVFRSRRPGSHRHRPV